MAENIAPGASVPGDYSVQDVREDPPMKSASVNQPDPAALVDRLRNYEGEYHYPNGLLNEAAAEIEQARAQIRELQIQIGLIEAEATEPQPVIKFYDDPVQFAREMAARLVVSRDVYKHKCRELEKRLELHRIGETWKGEELAIEVQRLRGHVAALTCERTQLRVALVRLVGVDGRTDLEQMEATMRLIPAPAEDTSALIDCIHALMATLE